MKQKILSLSSRKTNRLSGTFPYLIISYDVVGAPVSDFEIGDMTFEVGGKKIGKKQIESAAKGYVVADDIEYAFQNKIPIWMFGFLY